jgi:adenylosuccinate lyase
VLTEADITTMTDPAGYVGECGASVDRVVAQQAEWLGN